MTILASYNYHAPKTMEELLSLLKTESKAFLLAGGTDLLVDLKYGRKEIESVIDPKHLEGRDKKRLHEISLKKGELKLGALVTFSDLLESTLIGEHFPILQEMAITVASKAVRNRATIVGNLVSAVPSMDSAPALLLFDPILHIESYNLKKKCVIEKEVPLTKFFVSPRKTILKEGEMISSLSLKFPVKAKGNYGGVFTKLMRYRGEDLAQASVALLKLSDESYRVAFGALSPVPFRALPVEKILNSEGVTTSSIEKIAKLLPTILSPITDIRATKEYRLHMIAVMMKRSLEEVELRFRGEGTKGIFHSLI